ncbi:hypothetical protein ACFL47_07720 [Candidatus Latescibacterota bacterium]
MALYMSAWDLPLDEENIKAYNDKAKTWVARILKQPGVREFRAYRDPLRNSPGVMIHAEFDSLESVIKYLKNEDTIKTTDEMLALGCSNFVNEMWDGSPLIPAPLKP